jgi:hypothetical protein
MPKLHEKYLEEFDRHAPCDDTPGAPNIIATVRTNLEAAGVVARQIRDLSQ